MLYPAIDLSCFAIEAVVDIIMFTTILGIRFRDTRHPVIGLSMYFVCGNLIGYFFPNAFGWVCLCLFSYLTMLYITKASPFYTLMAYIISYLYTSFCEDFFFMAFTKAGVQSENVVALGSSLLLLAILPIIRCFVPAHRLFCNLMKGHSLARFLLLHLFAIYIVETGLYKFGSSDISAYIPYIASFALVIVITDIVLLNQQQTISRQQHDLANYNVYQPMMDDLIEDVTGRQHDFDNILTGIRMLPYTHTDYSSLKEALISSSDEVISEYRTTELLKINMFVIAGFIYSKQKQAEKAHKKLNIVVHSYLLESRMPEYELVRVLGILIDNALEAISEHDSMTLHLDSRDGRIIITTLNKGPLLTPEIRAKLFTAGYTTKTCDRQKHGLGLYNLRRLVFKYNGKIYLENDYLLDDTLVRFEVMV